VKNGESKAKRQRFAVLAVLGFGFFIDSAEDVALPMLFPAIRSALGLDVAALGLMTGVRIIFQTFSGPFWGMAADRFSRKWVLVIGAGLWGLWTSLCGLTFSFWQLFAAHVIACLGLGCLYPAAFSMVADTFGPHNRGKALGTIAAVGMLGIVAGAVIFGQLVGASDTGWRWAFITLGLASVVSGVLIAVAIRDPVRGAAEPELEHVITEEKAIQFRFHPANVVQILARKTVWVNFLQGVFLLTTINSLMTFFPTWLVDDRHLSQSHAMLIFGCVVVSLAVGSIGGGIVADSSDRRWPRYGRILISQISILVTLPAMYFLLIRATSTQSIIASALLAGFFIDWTRRGVKQPLVQNVIPPELRSTAMALTEFVQGAAASIIIIFFAGYAKRHGLTAALMILGCGSWTIALIVTSLYYLVYPADAVRLRNAMEHRRQLLAEVDIV
jgi:MFS family permease